MGGTITIWKEHLRKSEQTVKNLVSSITRRCATGGDSNDYDDDIVARVKDYLELIPIDNKKKTMEYLEILEIYGAPSALVSLLYSPIEGNKEIGEESIRLFTNPRISYLPKSAQNQFASIVLRFCILIRDTTAVQNVIDNHKPLYYSCRKTLISLLKSIGFANRLMSFGNVEASDLIVDFYPFLKELSSKLHKSIVTSEVPPSTCVRLSFERDIREFALFSLHMRRAIEEHVRSRGESLPLSVCDNFDKHPCYLMELEWFYDIFYILRLKLDIWFGDMRETIRCERVGEFNPRWSYYLPLLKELNHISKLFRGAEELFSSGMQRHQFSLDILIMYAKRSDDHQWLLKHKNVIDFNSRRRLMTMMFPEVREDLENLHMVIDRSQLLTESFEHLVDANRELLRNGLSVEFKNEVATGYGVQREWLFLVCQSLFNPRNSLFLACPSDHRRFFPHPAKVDPQHLNYFVFCGRVIALALKHKVQVGITFDRLFLLQLAGESISLEDIRCADPCMYTSCKKILEMDADFVDSDVMGLTFVREIEEFGSRKVVELCPGGSSIVVNSRNREEYIHLLIQHSFVKSISDKVAYFARGFGDILRKRRLQKVFLQSLDLKDLDRMLLGSNKAICVKDWKARTDYNDYKETDDQICWFWKVVKSMSLEQQRELLFFWTSVKYLPVNGFSGLPSRLCIYKTSGSRYSLPSSHTCFYRLALPQYPSFDLMQQSLLLICQEDVGCSFGLS